ncbi:hypothetical protein Psi01_21030 [Planobispora siamensis]|uniref:Uncharacterized protein n=1 Tax=Planobispora siamensis TaxID=936338 RepID=A0A8J3WJB4_9ACTN|nr:hypothetical protein Psi01_21030 [Planobispora siamensis]
MFPSTQPSQSAIPTATPEPSASSFEPDSSTVPYEIRNAGSEYNTTALSQQLGIPALILVLLVVFAILIFEGRLRRLAHAAAVRRAGPRAVEPAAYPAGPGYASAGFPHPAYQGGAAYAPIISFVPMQMYPPVYPEGYVPEQYPHGYDPAAYDQTLYEQQTTAYAPPPGAEQPFYGFDAPQAPGRPSDQPSWFEPAAPGDQGGHGRPGDPSAAHPQGLGDFSGAPFPQDPALQAQPPQDPAVPDRFPQDPGLQDMGPQGPGHDPGPRGPQGPGQEGPGQEGPGQEGPGQHGPGAPERFSAGPASPGPGPDLPPPVPETWFAPGGSPAGPPQGPADSPGGPFQGPVGPAGGPFQGPADGPGGTMRFPEQPPPPQWQGPAGPPPQDVPPGGATAVYPLPEKDQGKQKRGLFRRKRP